MKPANHQQDPRYVHAGEICIHISYPGKYWYVQRIDRSQLGNPYSREIATCRDVCDLYCHAHTFFRCDLIRLPKKFPVIEGDLS